MKKEGNNNFFENHKYVLYISFSLLSSILLLGGIILKNYNLSLIGVLLLWLISIVYCFMDLKNKIYLLLFYLTLFLFILSRPTISMLRGNVWWYFNDTSIFWSLTSLLLSILFLFFGSIISDRKKNNSKNNLKENNVINFFKNNQDTIRKISFILFIICFIASASIEIDKLIFMQGKNYEEYYISYINNAPFIINCLSALTFPFLVIFLITNPNKLYYYLTFVLFILLQIPMLKIGERGSFIKAILFAFVYISYRSDILCLNKKNIKKLILCLIMIFLGIIALGSYNYIRSDEKVPTFNPIELFIDFFYRQGTSYDTLNAGYNALEYLPNKENKNYTFGPFIDNFKNNILASKLFNITPIENGNSEEHAKNGNNFSHALAYTSRHNEYLQGHGIGSSYLIETYADYGYLGIIIYSFILGYFLSNIRKILDYKNIFSIITLYAMKEIYMVPRAEALGFLSFLFRLGFWFAILLVIIIVYIYKAIKKAR